MGAFLNDQAYETVNATKIPVGAEAVSIRNMVVIGAPIRLGGSF